MNAIPAAYQPNVFYVHFQFLRMVAIETFSTENHRSGQASYSQKATHDISTKPRVDEVAMILVDSLIYFRTPVNHKLAAPREPALSFDR